MRLRLSHKALILVGIPLVCEMIMLSVLLSLLYDTQNQKRQAEHARIVVEEADLLLRLYVDAGTKLIQYGFTRKQEVADAYPVLVAEVPKQYQKLRDLTNDNAHQQDALNNMKPVLDRGLALLGDIKHALDVNKGSPAAFLEFGNRKKEIQETVFELRTMLDKYIQPEKEIDRAAPKLVEQAALRTIEFIKLVFVLNALGGIALAVYVSRNIVRRLQILSVNSVRLAKKEALMLPVGGDDEIADVDRTFHAMANALAEAERKEREVEQLKQDFLAMVSHDLRTPLSSVLNVTTMMSHGIYGQLNDQGKQRTADVERELHRLLKLINDLLDIGKMEAGKFSLGIETASLDDIIDRSVVAVEALSEKKGIELKLPSSQALVQVDEDRIVQVLVNLLSNAIKFSPNDDIVEIACERSNDFAFVRVIDHGPGIAPDLHDSIFEKYKQVELSDAKQKGGTGLGLPICKAIIEQHGGHVGVSSQVGTGSTFWFTLPLSKTKEATAEATASGQPKS